MSLVKPNTEGIAYKRLWRNLNEEQRECLVKYNRIPVYTPDGNLFVIPYSRFHNKTWGVGRIEYFYHVSIQEFYKDDDGTYRFRNIYCGGVLGAQAAVNVLGIKLLLESEPARYTFTSERLTDPRWGGKLQRGMTLEETYEVEIDPIGLLGELPPKGDPLE